MSLLALKDLELRVDVEAEILGLNPSLPAVGPECVLGIEINPYAAELARVSVWIGHIQWSRKNGYPPPSDPVLRSLNTIECRDAVLDDTGAAAAWPQADFIIGNPPFLGAKLMRRRLGIDYTLNLRAAYDSRLAGFSDLVCFWFEKARDEVASGRAARAGLVATSSIRGGTNRAVMDRIASNLAIYDARSEMPWTIDGARVEVSLVCFAKPAAALERRLDGAVVPLINPDLTSGLDLTVAKPLLENNSASLLGIQTSGPHDIPGDLARAWAAMPSNPNGAMNGDILKPYWNGDDVTSRPRDMWLIDLPLGLTEAQFQFYSTAYSHLSTARYDPGSKTDLRSLIEARTKARDRHARERWWEPYWPRPEMRAAIARLERYIVTTETSEHRLFIWMRYPVLPDKNLIVIARDDDTTFGILHSRYHELWALRLGTSLEDRPRYTSTTTFRTFPFPDGLMPSISAATFASDAAAIKIAEAARKLVAARDKWLTPPELVASTPDTIPKSPIRLLPKDAAAAVVLKTRTLTNLYNGRGTPGGAWLDSLHRDLDEAVAEAYGWPKTITDDEALEKLLALNSVRPKVK
jgi:type II restriction/modification system DNA methylase subunit YeeA